MPVLNIFGCVIIRYIYYKYFFTAHVAELVDAPG